MFHDRRHSMALTMNGKKNSDTVYLVKSELQSGKILFRKDAKSIYSKEMFCKAFTLSRDSKRMFTVGLSVVN